jgi:dTDP-4-dehydrorhamnose reductase
LARILVLGAGGLLGINFALEASKAHEVIGTVNRVQLDEAPFQTKNVDLLKDGAVAKLLDDVEVDWLVNCVALADVDECERQPELADKLNRDLPEELAKECARREIKLVHISTDAVFDGADGNYREEDATQPINIYGRSKLDGEQAVLNANAAAIVARVNFFGWGLSGERSLSEFFFNKLSAGEVAQGLTDRYFSPLLVNDLSQLLLQMLEKGLAGLFHVVSPVSLSKYEFGQALAKGFGFEPNLIRPTESTVFDYIAARAPDLRLNVDKLTKALNIEMPDVYSGIERLHQLFAESYPEKLKAMRSVSPIERLSA